MSAPLVLYTHPMSRGRIARWMLEEVGQAYEARILDFGPAMRAPDYLALNPMGKVPTLVHGEAVVTECAAICAYLADAFPEAGLAPAPGDPSRGAYLRWLVFGAGPLEAAVTNQALGLTPPPERRGMVGYGSLEAVLDTLEGALARSPYLAGDRFTAADVYTGSQIAWGLAFGTIPKRAAFETYAGRISARPAAARARAIDDALLAERQGAAGG
jgi:glutathione S-transferase